MSSSEEPGPRDFNDEMNEKILALISTDRDFVPAVLAHGLVDELLLSDPDLLSGWLHLHAASFVSGMLRSHLRSWRARARLGARASAFSLAARAFAESGDAAVLGGWLNTRYVVDDQSTQRRLGDMTKLDLEFVASRYGRTAQTLLLEEAFHRALAARVGALTVGEVFTEDQISAMYRGLTNKTSIAAS